MLSRGYAGAIPVVDRHIPAPGEWGVAMLLPGAAAAVAVAATLAAA